MWQDYLWQAFPMDTIHSAIIYADGSRMWMGTGIANSLQQLGITVHLGSVDDLDAEGLEEIAASLPMLPDDSLLLSCISSQHPLIEDFDQVFPALHAPLGFKGYSMVTLHDFPDAYLLAFARPFQQLPTPKEDTLQLGGLQVSLRNLPVPFPFRTHDSSRHVIYPATEYVSEIATASGQICGTMTIGPYIDGFDLIHPFGPAGTVAVTIDDGIIIEIEGDNSLVDEMQEIIGESPQLRSIGFGAGPDLPLSGLAMVDRLLSRVISLRTDLLELIIRL